MTPYDGPVLIHEEYKKLQRYTATDPEQDVLIGYSVTGGGWMRSHHRTLKAADKEVLLRQTILAEREARGE